MKKASIAGVAGHDCVYLAEFMIKKDARCGASNYEGGFELSGGGGMRVLVLAASGMLGHAILHSFKTYFNIEVYGTVRDKRSLLGAMPGYLLQRVVDGVDAYDINSIEEALLLLKPNILINCIGVVRQRPEGRQPMPCIELNARLPHLLLTLCRKYSCRLVHVSTDCVFDGRKEGVYTEEDPLSAHDVYGITKYLGELHEAPAVTLRTSIIGPELRNKLSLVEWFLAQKETVRGYSRAIYAGVPTCELARVIAKYVLPNPDLTGLYQVASSPISKFDLLRLIADVYGKKTVIVPDDNTVNENKAMSCAKFNEETGYVAPPWPVLVKSMHAFHNKYIKELS